MKILYRVYRRYLANKKALPAERFGSASAIHARFLEWEKACFHGALWKADLTEYDNLEGIAWRWQSMDGAMMKAPLARSVPTRPIGEKNGSKRHLLVDGPGVPLPFIVTVANRHDVSQLKQYYRQSWSQDPSRPCAEASICVQTLDTRERRRYTSSKSTATFPRKGARTRSS